MKPVDPRLLRYAAAARGFFVVSALIGVAQTGVTVAFAFLLTDAITGVIAGRDVTAALASLVGVVALRGVLVAASEAAGTRAAAKTGSQLRSAVMAALGRLGPGWLAERSQARLALSAGRGLEALDVYFARYVPQLMLTAIATPVLIAVIWWQDWLSGLAALLTLPMIPIFLILIGMATRGVQQRQWETLQRIAVRFTDTVQGLSTLRLFGRDQRAARNIAATSEQYRKETMVVLRYSFLSGFAMELLASLAVAIIAVSIGLRLLAGDMDLAVGLAVLILAPEVFLPIRQVGVQFHAATEGVAATEGIFEVLDAANVAPPRAAAAETDGARTLELLDVRVRRGEQLLPSVSLHLRPGQIALVEGPSGCGKSSVLAALRGAADYDGEILLDGEDLRRVEPSGWIAWAGQQPSLMRGTVATNVGLGDPAPDQAEILRALRDAGAGEIDPSYELGVHGEGLSGGQAQRVAVARALYRSQRGNRVLVLDEPSSALDVETEKRLWESLRVRADGGAAILLVSHRRSARAIADSVVSLAVPA